MISVSVQVMLNWLTPKHHPMFSVIFSDEWRLCQITLFNHSIIIKKSSSVHQNSTTRIHSDVTATPFAWTCYLIPSNIVQYREHLRDTAVHTCVSVCVCVCPGQSGGFVCRPQIFVVRSGWRINLLFTSQEQLQKTWFSRALLFFLDFTLPLYPQLFWCPPNYYL